MQNLFNSIEVSAPKRNVFDLSHDVKLSFNMGELVPIMCLEAVPGDRFNVSVESLIRFQPLISPVMHRMDATFHYFFVPNRILWPNWETFITGSDNGKPVDNPPAFPLIKINPVDLSQYTRLCDYLGIPTPLTGGSTENLSALPFAAYQKIYDDYYRDQNLIDSLWQPLTDGMQEDPQQTWLKDMRYRAWEHDYFTSGLPFAQKGQPVAIPLGDVTLKTTETGFAGAFRAFDDYGDPVEGPISATAILGSVHAGSPDNKDAVYDPQGSLEVQPTTINDLRRAFSLQKYLEKLARAGSRYFEFILVMFGLRSPDSRLQRPEYVAGAKSPVVISEVLNTTGTDDLPQGNMSGHGISVTNGHRGSYSCMEHGYIIGLLSVRPKPAYQQGIPRHFLKTVDRFQYYTPDLAHIGEQEILYKELYAYTSDGDDTFAYNPRYSEYKFMPNVVAGDMRTTLDFWHLGRIFDPATPPQLNQAFIECKPTFRVFAVTDPTEDHLIAHVYNKIHAVRPMPKFGTPTL